MQAGNAPALPLTASGHQKGRRRPASVPDLFQACLQGRLASHLGEGTSAGVEGPETSRPGLKGFCRSAGQAPGPAAGVRKSRKPAPEGPALPLIPPSASPRLAATLVAAGASPERLCAWLAARHGSAIGMGLKEGEVFGRALSRASDGCPRAIIRFSDSPLPPMDLAAFLSRAGRPSEGGRNVPGERPPTGEVISPNAPLPGRTKGHPLPLPLSGEAGPTPEGPVAGRHPQALEPRPGLQVPANPADHQEWQRIWPKLRLPAAALPELKLALQNLGVPLEALATLEGGTEGAGISLEQVWQLMKETQRHCVLPSTPEAEARSLADAAVPGVLHDAENWRRLLVKSGLAPEVVEMLWGGSTPHSLGELRAKLLSLAPKEAPRPAPDSPKPLYLPEKLQFPSWLWQKKDAPPEKPGPPAPTPLRGQSPLDGGGTEPVPLPPTPSAPPHAPSADPGLPASGAGEATPPLLGDVRPPLWSQVQQAVITNLKPGETKVNLTLNPPELGEVTLTLNLRGQELVLAAVTTRPEVAHLAQTQVAQLAQALAQQGLVLAQFQVQVQDSWPGTPANPAPPVSRMGGRKAPPETSAKKGGATRGVDCFV